MLSIKKNWPFLLGLILSSSLLWPIAWAPFFTHHDDVQTIRLYEMDKCIKDGQIPCRWVPDLGDLYGYPLFNYYAPLPYYYGEIFYFLTNNLILSVKVMFITAFLGAYIFMYLFARRIWGDLGGAISALFYSFAPYHALDFYVRGEMGEMWGLMLFPAIFWAFLKLKEKSNIKNILLVAFFIGFLIVSHNLSAMIFLPIALIWVVILYFNNTDKKFLIYSLFSFVLGIALSAFYSLPMFFEKNLVHIDTTTIGYFSYTEHFKGLRKLFLDRSWGYGSSVREVPGGERDTLSYQIGWVHLLGWILSMYVTKRLWKKNKFVAGTIFFASLITALSIFMINPRSEFIWNILKDFLKYLQFPWRLLLVIIFMTSFLSGSIFVLEPRRKYLIFCVFLILLVGLNFYYFKPEKFLYINDQQLLSGASWDKLIQRSIYDFLPIAAKEPPAFLAGERFQILTGNTKVTDFKEGTNWINFNTETKSHSIIRLSQYYFPNWRIFVDGKVIRIDYGNNSLGLMTFILGIGNHTIDAKLYDTPIRTVSNEITLLSLLLSLLLFTSQFSNTRKWVQYYRKRIN